MGVTRARWLLVVSSACMSTPQEFAPMYHFSESPRFVGIDRLLYPWPRAINCLVHWSSPVRKLVFSQQYRPVRRSSPVRKLVATYKFLVV